MSNKKILSNTLMLYIRLLITLLVSLYSTRIVLKNLGAEDYGLYGTVAGVIALIAFLQNALSGATNRFFNVEIIKNDITHIQRLFSTSIFLHIGIALFICFALEIVGVVAFTYYIHLPADKVIIANEILHLSVFSLFFLIVTIPFEALLVAKENFKAYAFISIFETFLKLIVAYLLMYLTSHRLFYYAFGLLLSTLVTRSFYVCVVKYLYSEAKFKAGIDRVFLKQIFGFIGWDLYGNFAVILRVHGTTLIMNNFFGLVMVASIQIGNQILAAISSFSGNFLLAIRPQLMKSYAENDVKRMNELTIYSAKYSYYLMLILSVPIIMTINYILKLWLVNPPPYSQPIAIFMLISALMGSIFLPLNIIIHATGNIKGISLLTGSLILLSLPITYALFYLKFDYYWAYILSVVVSMLAGLVNLLITKKMIAMFDIKYFCKKVLLNVGWVSLLIVMIMTLIIYLNIIDVNSFVMMIFMDCLSGLLTLTIVFLFGVDKVHKHMVFQYTLRKLKVIF